MFEFNLATNQAGNQIWPPKFGPSVGDAGFEELLEANLRLTPWERMLNNDKLLNEWLEFESFIHQLQRGWKLIQLHHGNTR